MNNNKDDFDDLLITRTLRVESKVKKREISIKKRLIRISWMLITIKDRSFEHSTVSDTPPQFAKYLIYLLVPRNNREAILGDLEEDFHEVNKKFGLQKAKFHYMVQVLRSIWPMLKCMAVNILIITKKLITY